jgi:hypothetical protein
MDVVNSGFATSGPVILIYCFYWFFRIFGPNSAAINAGVLHFLHHIGAAEVHFRAERRWCAAESWRHRLCDLFRGRIVLNRSWFSGPAIAGPAIEGPAIEGPAI